MRSRNAPSSVVTDPYADSHLHATLETYTIQREDSWILRVMLNDSAYAIIKFWVLHKDKVPVE